MQNQINSEESDLESMLAQQNALNHETSYATVTLSIVGPKAPVTHHIAVAKPPPGLTGGLSGGWHAFRLTVSWLLTVIGAVAPFLAVIVVVGGLGWWSRRRLQQRRQPPPSRAARRRTRPDAGPDRFGTRVGRPRGPAMRVAVQAGRLRRARR